jgi:hypothetical protein
MANDHDSNKTEMSSKTLPDDVRERGDVVLNLQMSGFYRHFIERFLAGLGGILHVPWWAIHILLYVMTWGAFLALVDARTFFPGWGEITWSTVMLAEFLFTTFMILKIREIRMTGFKLASRISSPEQRSVWLRKHIGPVFWGWGFRLNLPGMRKKNTVVWVRTWHVTIFLMLVLYVSIALFVEEPRVSSGWEAYFPNFLCVYTQIVKCAMLTAVLAYFSFLSGVVQIATGRYETSLDAARRQLLFADCRQLTLQVSVVVGLATGLWMLGDGLSLGINECSYALTLGLLVLFVFQAAIIEGVSLRNFKIVLSRIANNLLAPQPSPVSYRRGEILAAFASSFAPVILNLFGFCVRNIVVG